MMFTYIIYIHIHICTSGMFRANLTDLAKAAHYVLYFLNM